MTDLNNPNQATLEAPGSVSVANPGLTLTEDQEAAMQAFLAFLMDEDDHVFVLEGYAGCGKTTLVTELMARLTDFMSTALLINPRQIEYEVLLTATTNKAAENLASISKHPVSTTHSALGLRVNEDFKTGEKTLTVRRGADPVCNKLLFIDEASYVDSDLLQKIFTRVEKTKVVFIGDPAQLVQHRTTKSPVFNAGFTTARLTKVMRQAEGNPIIELATAFRNTVNTGEFFSFTPDGVAVEYMDETNFHQALLEEFGRPNWKNNDSKVLAWTNKRVNGYNHFIRENIHGEPNLQAGDYAICNEFMQLSSGQSFKTDQLVQITNDHGPAIAEDVDGRWIDIEGSYRVFLPNDLKQWTRRLADARANDEFETVRFMTYNFIDLRAAFACTVNKAQGSTYDKVYIDLDDIRRCPSGNQMARMLYVAVSRARHKVVLTGDIA